MTDADLEFWKKVGSGYLAFAADIGWEVTAMKPMY